MPGDQTVSPGLGIAVAIRVEERTLRDRIAAALRELPDIDVGRSAGEANTITITDRIDVMQRIAPEGPVLVLADRRRAWAALRAGAAGVLARSAGVAELRLAIDALLHGLVVLPAGSSRDAEEDPSDDLSTRLTAREREVLTLLAEGASNKMIARTLAVSIHTVKFHVASILEKLDATGRTDAVAHAVRLGVLML